MEDQELARLLIFFDAILKIKEENYKSEKNTKILRGLIMCLNSHTSKKEKTYY